MPSSCYDCPFVKNERTNDYGSFCECGIFEDCETINLLAHSKHHNCPLIEQNSMLDNIRAEIENTEIVGHIRDVECFNAGINVALNVINKYKA